MAIYGRALHRDADTARNSGAYESAYSGEVFPDGRYFGFLANRACGEKLPVVFSALGMDKPKPVPKVCYAQMSKQYLRRDQFECVLCGGQIVYRRAVAGLNVQGLKLMTGR